MKRLTSLFLSSVVAFGLVFAVGCDSGGSLSDGESGTLDLNMSGTSTKALVGAKASPDDVTSAIVTITEVAVVPADDTSEGDSTDVGVQTLTDGDFVVDLKDLQAGLDTAMAQVDIPADTYSQVRLIVDGEVDVTFDNGDTESVMIASGEQTGLKVNHDAFTIDSEDDRVELTINWDVESSLQGHPSGQLVITPVISGATVNASNANN